MHQENQQLEFDLVSPFLAPPTWREMERVRKSAGLPKPATIEEVNSLRTLTARINVLDLVHDDHGVSLNDELAKLRVLIGKVDWDRDKKIWTRRGKRDPRRLKKIILAIRSQLKI